MAQHSTDVVVDRLLRLLFRSRRLNSDNDPCAGKPCAECFAWHWRKTSKFVVEGEPVHFVIPAFPAKSRSTKKVLGALPDLAETVAIWFLQSFCDQVAHVYPPGARITICSDGHVFSDVLGIPDEQVSRYRAELQRMIRSTGGGSIDIYSLENVFGELGHDEMRRLLLAGHGSTIEQIRERTRTQTSARSLFNGIHRFLVEDESVLRPEISRTRLRAECKSRAYEVIQRSDAWGALVADVFPRSLRLSIHPQPGHGEKIGFHLIRTADNWLTPWHGVVIDDGSRFTLARRSDAEDMNATLVWRNSRPSHFVVPHDYPEDLVS
jgi:pyoverdine/dityrosine biosynthesis protein Dit1